MGRHKDRDAFLKRELDRTLETYGNHPSFILMTMGNELRGNDEFLTALVEQAKEKDPRRIYSSTSHHHRSKSDQFRITMRIGNEKIKKKGIKIRGLRGPKTDWDFADAIKDENIPVIAHEIGQFCAWPDLSEIRQYRGLLKAKNFELFGDRLTQRGMKRQARDFLMASGKLQAICYKEEIESLMRTPDFGGFQLLDLHDFPGQGTSLVGVLNPYWKSKGYITAREYRRFAGQTVPLARFEKRTWTNNETFTAQIDLSHFGQHDLKKCKAEWKLIDISNRTIAKGKLPAINAPASSLTTIGQISINLSSIKEPSKLKLSVSIPSATASNDWNLWIYPNTTDDSEPENVYIASSLDDKAITTLAKGGNVVMLPPIANINGRHESWQPIFWNTQWISRTGNRSLGLLCSSKHPALADFPTDFHSDWQWHGLMNNSKTVNLAHTPEGLKPIVQVIPDWNNPQREAMIFECKVGKGNLLFCSADLTGDLQERTTAKQLRKSLLKYAAGESFEPKTEMSLSQIRSMLISM